MPGRGMGWYHAKQILDGEVPSAVLTDIVEPWFLGGGADGPGGKEFAAFKKEHEGSVRFHASIKDMPKPDGKMMAMVCTRTADMPGYVADLTDHGVSHVFLEKPGAPTVEELGKMKDECAAKGATIWMGFNKNVTAYVTKGREALAKVPGGDFTLVHHNAYKADELGECFERNAEGMLKNMAIHELALLATYYGVTVDNIASVTPDAEYSRCLTLKGPDGVERTDFAKIGFTVATKAGKVVTVRADRCGSTTGGGSEAVVTVAGVEKFKSLTPEPALQKHCDEMAKNDPDMMPYFVLQHDDYIKLKETATSHILSGASGAPPGMATIDIAVETLRVAEYLTPYLQKALAK